jgi:sugar/nucleoside kinase (ribokinase family)
VSTGKTCDVAVFGDLFVDLVMAGFSQLPKLGEEAHASSFRREAGGGAAITSCGLASLGARTRVIGMVGATDLAWFRQKFESKGVDTRALVAHRTEPTAITVAVSTSSDRVFYTYAGANASLPQLLTAADSRQAMASARHVHFAHLMDPSCLEELGQWLRAQGCTISVDVGWHESWLADPASIKALRGVDWFFPNQTEAARMTGESDPCRVLKRFRNLGLTGVVLKLGAAGCASLAENELVREPAVPVQAIDLTGAGDCFDAGFLFAWLAGKPLRESLRWGSVCGSLSTRRHGGIEAFPTRAEIESALTRDQEKTWE